MREPTRPRDEAVPRLDGADNGCRTLGIDTSLRSTGLGVVEANGNRYRMTHQAVVRNPAALPLTACLLRIGEEVSDMIRQARPAAAAIEGAFFQKNARTAMILGHARGVAIAACAKAGLPVYEYAPRRVKQAIVGYGGADKSQVAQMIGKLLALDAVPQEDIGDALAIALCHLHSQTGYAALSPQTI